MLASVRGHFPKGLEMIPALGIAAFTVAAVASQIAALIYVLTAEPPSDAELDALEAGALK